jgi:exopolysaccharide production protein ExoQ
MTHQSDRQSLIDLPNDTVGNPLSIALGVALLLAFIPITTVNLIPDSNERAFAVDWQTLLRLGLCASCGLYGLWHLNLTLPLFGRFAGLWCILFGLWALLSVPFSDTWMYAAAAVFSLWCVILFAPAVLMQLGGRRTVETILAGTLLLVGLNWFFYFAVPQIGRTPYQLPDGGDIIYRLGNDAQQLGLQAAWAVGFLLALAFARLRRGWTLWLPLALCVVTLPLTQSRTAMLTAAAIVGWVCWRHASALQRWFAALFLLMVAAVGAFCISAGLLAFDGDELLSHIARSGEADEIYSVTGRTEIWEFAQEKVLESPLLGYGYGSSRFALSGHRDPNFSPDHAHNLLLNVALGSGIPAAALLVIMLAAQIRGLARQESVVPQIATVIVLVAGFSEPVLFGPMPRSHTLIWLVMLFWRPLGASLGASIPPLFYADPMNAQFKGNGSVLKPEEGL